MFMICSCSPEKRLNRLLTKHPDLIQIDSVLVSDTILIPERKYDTLVKILEGDTIIIIKDRITTKLIKLPGDSIIVQTTVPGDTIVKTHYIYNTVYKDSDKWYNEIPWWVVLVLILTMLLLIIVVLKKS